MKTLLTILLAVHSWCTYSQCKVEHIEHIQIYSSHHCTSNSFHHTKVAFTPIVGQTRIGQYEWRVLDTVSGLWHNLSPKWKWDSHTGVATSFSVDSTDNMREYMCIFIEDSTFCRDSSIKRLVLDNSPIIACEKVYSVGKLHYFVSNLRNTSGIGDEIIWKDRFDRPISSQNMVSADQFPCLVRIIDCIGCVDELYFDEHCMKEDIFIYPNPASEYIYINGNGSECQVDLFDMSGRCIVHTKGSMTTSIISIEHFSVGMYVLRVCEQSFLISVHH
ncbi:MAG: T9SS type A sorting domain-containing protein [Candidatus Pacebacteria bacterium]|nr:T9SS type A sorting domain-containing protein [Candidatus Paceibacterota bacterium]MBP9780808.1 T9SS type A sorting domain-containing protein [Candidatus Paceibacterota bacterium]